jgi:amidohydrolase
VPALLAHEIDPTIPFSVVWGAVAAGAASNVIPTTGVLRGSVRTMDPSLWDRAETLVRSAVEAAAGLTGATAVVEFRRGVPPVVNDAAVAALVRSGVTAMLGGDAVAPTPASMGGEDFGWYLQTVPGALARLGVRPPGAVDEESGPLTRPEADLHRATFDVDERAIGIGVRALVGTALVALDGHHR